MGIITGPNHTSFTVSDMDASVAFYRDLLGMEVISEREELPEFASRITGIPGAHLKITYLQAPGGYWLELIQYLSPPGQKLDVRTHNVGSAHLAFNVGDVDRAYAELSARGVHMKSAPTLIERGPNRGGRGLYLADPDGITIELIQPGKAE